MSVSENIKTLKDLVDTLSWELASPVLVSHIIWFYKEFVKYVNLFEQKDLENQLISKLKIKKEALMYLISLPDRSQIAKALLNPEYQNIHVKSLLPKEGFIKDYIEYTSEHEAPTLFHLWVCVSFLGALLKRHIYYDNMAITLSKSVNCHLPLFGFSRPINSLYIMLSITLSHKLN